MLSLTSLQWTGAAVAALLVGLSKAGFGAGAGILAVPLMVTVLGSTETLPVMLMVLLVGDVFALAHYRRARSLGNLAVLVPGMLAGILGGALVLEWFLDLPDGELWLRRAIGLIAVAFVMIQLYREQEAARLRREQATGFRPRPWQGVLLGAGSGLASTLAHAGGPPVVLYLLPQGLSKRVFVGTIVRFFFIANLAKVVPYAWQGLFTARRAAVAGVLVPAVLAGTLLGALVHRRVSDRLFRVVVYALAFALGIYLLSGWEPGSAEAGAESAFERGLRAYEQQRFTEAAHLFGQAVGAQGSADVAAQLNQGLALYRAGRYRAAEDALQVVRQSQAPALAARAAYNLGNCAYRRGQFGAAVDHYGRALREALALWEGGGGGRARKAELAELSQRAAANLAVASRRAQAAEPPSSAQRSQADGGMQGAEEDARAGGTGDGTGGAEQIGQPGGGAATAAGAGHRRTVDEILLNADRGDRGPIIRSDPDIPPSDGPDW
ncbi:MAG: TSUP family transporter [Candidatus Brocadiia bacterium]